MEINKKKWKLTKHGNLKIHEKRSYTKRIPNQLYDFQKTNV